MTVLYCAVLTAGYSPFPGNINQLVIKLLSYVEQLAKTGASVVSLPALAAEVHLHPLCQPSARQVCAGAACLRSIAGGNGSSHGSATAPGVPCVDLWRLDEAVLLSPLPHPGGTIGEFVNPKYKDATKTAFKSSTRLECMMQDYPKALPADARVGFIAINQVRAQAVDAAGDWPMVKQFTHGW